MKLFILLPCLLGLLCVAQTTAQKPPTDSTAAEAPAATDNKPVTNNFTADGGKYRFTLDATAAPDLMEWADKELRPVVQEWYPKLVAMLPSDGYAAPTNVTLRFRNDMGGTPASAGGGRINMNSGWFRKELKREARGSVVHEMVHVVQDYGRARRTNPNATRTPGWLVEGIPDYIRWFLYEPETKGAEITERNLARAKYDASYRVTGNFLNWVTEKHDKDIVRKLNTAAREGKYTEQLWKDYAGKTVQELGGDWKQAHEARLASWPQWRGPARTGHATGLIGPSALPKELTPLWKTPVGGGHAGPVLAGGKLVYLDENGSREIAHALDAATGKELWQIDYADVFGDEWGNGPRATPLLDGERLYVQSCNGEFRCLSLKDGKVIWQTNYEKDFGVKFLGNKANEGTATRRGNNGSGVIDGQRIILPVGGRSGASLVCFDKLTGKVLWQSGDDEAAYSSFMVDTLAGVRQVVAFTADALLGADLATGKILWRVPLKTNAKRHTASPVILGDRVFVNSHSIGLVCFEISKEGDGQKATQAWANKELLINLATPVAVGGCLYSQGARGDYVCVDAKTGTLKWSQPGFGGGKKDYASTIAAGDKLLVLTEGGQLILLAADPEKYTELGRLQVCGSTWSFPAYAGGKLYVRDARQLLCLDLTAR